jgi:hypothetical protein
MRHEYKGSHMGRAQRLHTKLEAAGTGEVINLDKLEELVGDVPKSACSCDHAAGRHDRSGCCEMVKGKGKQIRTQSPKIKCPCLWTGPMK